MENEITEEPWHVRNTRNRGDAHSDHGEQHSASWIRTISKQPPVDGITALRSTNYGRLHIILGAVMLT